MELNGKGIRILQIWKFICPKFKIMNGNCANDARCNVGTSVHAKAGHIPKANGSIGTCGMLSSVAWLNGTVLLLVENQTNPRTEKLTL